MSALASPLVQVERGPLRPKIIRVYEDLFKDGSTVPENESFWLEFFLLNAKKAHLGVILANISPEHTLQFQGITQALFSRSINALVDDNPKVIVNALITLNVLVREILAKHYTNQSADVISLLTGITRVDSVLPELVTNLEIVLKRSELEGDLRVLALSTTVSIVCDLYRTGLIEFFIHRDLFPALVQLTVDPATTTYTFEAFTLIGILANYNKLESYNPYQTRLSDLINEQAMLKIVYVIGSACRSARNEYIEVSDDTTESWSLDSMLSLVGFKRANKPQSGDRTDTSTSSIFAALPPPSVTILLATIEFVHINKFFCKLLIEARPSNAWSPPESPFAAFISLSSYLLHHQHRSERHRIYARVPLLVFRILAEDQNLFQVLTSPNNRSILRLCRQRVPLLPLVKDERLLVEGVLDCLVASIDHSMKKSLDVSMYEATLACIRRIISQLKRQRIRLKYHWAELWRSLISLTKFMANHSQHLIKLPSINNLVDETIRILVLAFSSGELFLHDAEDYDDLFYKFVETGDLFKRISEKYEMYTRATSIETLISIAEHYNDLIEQKSVFFSGQLSTDQVSEIIRSGYDSLSISSQDEVDRWDKYREVDERSYLKRLGLMSVADAKDFLRTSSSGSLPSIKKQPA
ncbi:uncharacterized protein V1510DRAFT_368759 [Dipodascopsis tothii]|uniref:uncharacterized protein n=1 Tax=Dipodascopsis tothii TaxID=44089 RepID=UPI0034CED763